MVETRLGRREKPPYMANLGELPAVAGSALTFSEVTRMCEQIDSSKPETKTQEKGSEKKPEQDDYWFTC